MVMERRKLTCKGQSLICWEDAFSFITVTLAL